MCIIVRVSVAVVANVMALALLRAASIAVVGILHVVRSSFELFWWWIGSKTLSYDCCRLRGRFRISSKEFLLFFVFFFYYYYYTTTTRYYGSTSTGINPSIHRGFSFFSCVYETCNKGQKRCARKVSLLMLIFLWAILTLTLTMEKPLFVGFNYYDYS
jgi:hypothetical protein